MEAFTSLAIIAVVFFLYAPRRHRNYRASSRPKPKNTQYFGTPSPFDTSTSQATAEKQEIRGAAYVVDGDTIVIQRTQIRLFGIDAPELSHPYGRISKNAMMNLCRGQIIIAEIVAIDAYGRRVAKCWLPDGRDLSAELVKQGLALDWKKFSGGVYRQFETHDARQRLWLADARQQGRMYVWENFEANRRT